jgi:predicted metallo-beta-lactamase superfamily hydrolase
MGTRSMATFVETKDCSILVDPGVALGPIRYGLSPHPKEEKLLDLHWRKIKKHAKKAKVLTISHYHFDHHDPDKPNVYKGKILLTKHPEHNINKSQKKRAAQFLKELGEIPKNLEFADGEDFSFRSTTIRFSEAVPHGSNTKLGYVTQILIKEGRSRFIHTSDVQGPCLPEHTEFILQERPHVLFCDGPMSYMLGFRYSKKALGDSLENLIMIIEETKVKKLVLDHHLLRDLKWNAVINPVLSAAKEQKVRIMTMAEFAGEKNLILEARRKELWGDKVKKKTRKKS